MNLCKKVDPSKNKNGLVKIIRDEITKINTSFVLQNEYIYILGQKLNKEYKKYYFFTILKISRLFIKNNDIYIYYYYVIF